MDSPAYLELLKELGIKKKVLDISKRKEYGNDFLFSLRGIRKFMKKSYRIKTMSAKAFHFFGAGTNG